ncbi:hypothetical protein PYCCODRAFT_1450228 [Trametes coccinea BRFM310]|uniref:Uncharacterized protein n=1 Tax=Trametes coccinea (strain BRFM310) TaxID=1353009 RepID=A0A1Y2J011_TRAC3|nr:hypothetical protein PYCCODRAFT_1450228 [Trametes coccinea BRFM310]
MPTTRAQEAAEKRNLRDHQPAAEHKNGAAAANKPASKTKKPTSTKKSAAVKKGAQATQKESPTVGEKREPDTEEKQEQAEEPPAKKAKTEGEQTNGKEESSEAGIDKENGPAKRHPAESMYQAGTIERGHIYFFYRPKVELEEAHSLDDVQRFYMLLVPRPPQFAAHSDSAKTRGDDEDQEMNLIESGADAVPAPEPKNQSKKRFRLLLIGKKGLPDPDAGGGGKGGGRKQVFWATVATVGDDLKKLEEGLGPKTYETKTRGTRHQGAARLAARGAYAIVNNEDARTPSQRETHFGYHLSHPDDEHFGEVQETLGIHQASSFVLQVKNPLAPPSGPAQVGLPKGRRAEYPEEILEGVFGKGGGRGRESYGLRFASVERRELLDYEGAELLFIAARSGEQGLETSLGEGRGHALEEAEKSEAKETMDEVMKELAMADGKIPVDPLEGEWA